MRLAIVASHPVQYQAPLFRELARQIDLMVFFAHRATPANQAAAGFGVPFDWDVDLFEGYQHQFLHNVAHRASLDRFAGTDTPEVGEFLRAGQFDALLVTGWHLKSFLQAAWAAKRIGLPVAVRGDSQLGTQRSSLKKAGKAIAYPAFLRLFDAALYVGQRSRAYYEHYSYPVERLFSSPHCVDNAWFAARATAEARRAIRERFGIAPYDRVVLFAGKLVPFKRPLDVVDACAILRAKGIEAFMLAAGSGELEHAMRSRAASTAVPLHLLGFQNQTEMPAAYAAADLLALPSSSETWGLVANEALACGRPIVVSDACGCAPDLAGDGTAGRVFPVGEVAALAKALNDILREPPHPDAITAKSAAYGLCAAADGVRNALDYLRDTQSWRTS